MRSLEVQLFDVFTDRPFGGNVAGVVLDAGGLSTGEMQAVAAELAAPTSGFVTGRDGDRLELRFFTPKSQIDLCGHVTLAVAVARALDQGGDCSRPIVFETPAGRRRVQVETGACAALLTGRLAQSVPELRPARVDRRRAAHALGLPVAALAPQPLQIAATGLRHLVVGLADVAALGRSSPDFQELAELSRELEVDTVAAFALLDGTGAHLRCRDFCVAIGEDEEAASGTTASGVASYCWEQRLLEDAILAGELVVDSEQGVEMGRPSRIRTRLTLRDGRVTGVEVAGTVRRSLYGTLYF